MLHKYQSRFPAKILGSGDFQKKPSSSQVSLAAFSIFLFSILLAILAIEKNLGTDFEIYKAWYFNLDPWSINSCEGFESAFCLIGMGMSKVGITFSFFLALHVLCIYFFIFFTILHVSSGDRVSFYSGLLFIATVPLVLLKPEIASHLTRQYIAGAILCLCLINKNRTAQGFLVILASMFHISAVVFMVPLFFRVRLQIYLLFLIFVLFASYPFGLLLNYIISVSGTDLLDPNFSRLLYNVFHKLEAYSGRSGADVFGRAGFFILFALVLVSMVNRVGCLRDPVILLIRFFIFSLTLFLLFYSFSGNISERWYQYAKVFFIVVFPFVGSLLGRKVISPKNDQGDKSNFVL